MSLISVLAMLVILKARVPTVRRSANMGEERKPCCANTFHENFSDLAACHAPSILVRSQRLTLQISRILHAGYFFKTGDTQIIFDPIFESPFSRNCFAYPEVRFNETRIRSLKLDAVFISHFHDDHCSMESLNWIDRDTPIYLYCEFEELRELVQSLGFRNVQSLQVDQEVMIGNFKITPLLALDPEIDTLFHVRVGELNILNVVDSWLDPSIFDRLKQFAPWDLVLWPFQTMRELAVLDPRRAEPAPENLPPEWLDQLALMRPRLVIPSSCQFVHEAWSWYNHALFPITYRQFEIELAVRLPETQVLRLDPSKTVFFEGREPRVGVALDWVKLVEDTLVDYDYRPGQEIPSTSSIAQRFPDLTKQQRDAVRAYCEAGILKRYAELGPTNSGYFDPGRIWTLAVYDSNGIATHFQYRLQADEIKRLHGEIVRPEWMTEILAVKLYAALFEGEALSSIYLRVNDFSGAPEIEDALRSVDVLEDPLIRCLYEGSVASYQKAQLKRILR